MLSVYTGVQTWPQVSGCIVCSYMVDILYSAGHTVASPTTSSRTGVLINSPVDPHSGLGSSECHCQTMWKDGDATSLSVIAIHII